MDRPGPKTIFNILLMSAGSGHYAKAGQTALPAPPRPGEAIAIDLEGRQIRGIVDQVYIPPGCDEHCIGTLFLHEA